MTDVFISYKREERDAAQRVAGALESRGFTVWWDADILPGEQYRDATNAILRQCKAAIVIWSPRSVRSSWVLDEAARALKRGVLVPIVLEAVAEDEFPLGFGQVHIHDLVGWRGDPEDRRFLPVCAALERLTGAPDKSATAPNPDLEIAFWRGVHDSANPADFAAYLARFPAGLFAELARQRLDALGQHKAQPQPPRRFAQTAGPAPLAGADLAVVAAAATLAPLILWPPLNFAIGANLFLSDDYRRILDFVDWHNVPVVAAILTALAWAWSRGQAALAQYADAGAVRVFRFGFPAIAFVVLLALPFAEASADQRLHLILWQAAAWAAAFNARRIAAWVRARIPG